MAELTAQLRSIPDTQAAVGWVGGHTIIVDRPTGKAGGLGLGFNGGQLLAIAIGGCFCNDLRYVAEKLGIAVQSIAVDVTLVLGGEPLLATDAEVKVDVTPEDPGANIDKLIELAAKDSTVSNSLIRGIPVRIARAR